MSTNVLVRDIYPIIEKSLAKKENRDMIKKSVEMYLDKNSEKLSTSGPVFRTVFNDDDRSKLFDAMEISPAQVKRAIDESDYIKGSWKKIAEPFYVTCVLGIRYATIVKDDDLKNKLIVYLVLALYPSLHYKYFKYECVENIMNYTINNLSNKYKIKQQGTIFFALYDTLKVSDENETEDIKRGADKDVVDYVNSAQARINSLLKNISNEYYKNHKDQLYLNAEEDSHDENKFHSADSNIFAVERITNQVLLKLLVDGPNIKLIDYSAKMATVSVNELRNYINTIINSDNREDIKLVIESILFLYLYNEQNKVEEISSSNFLLYCSELYRKSNTSDKNIIRIKAILDKWLQDVELYKKTQRLATINDFRRSIYYFFILSIQTINA